MAGILNGKVIVIAGAGEIGTGLTKRYVAEGARVVVGDVSLDAAEAAAGAAGEGAYPVRLDGGDEESIRGAVETAVGRFGGLDGLHVNFTSAADGNASWDVLALELDAFDEVMRINTRGFLLCTRAALPLLIARGGGVILYTSSAASFVGLPAQVAYSMSKAATNALMRSVARQYGARGIRANALTPGFVPHAMALAHMDPQTVEAILGNVPLGRFGAADDMSAMSAFLMSDAANYVTGQLISVDGGSTMR